MRLLVVAILVLATLAGCAAREPWERKWPEPGSRAWNKEPPYLWCGLEPAEMTRRIVGAFPLGSSRMEVEDTIERLGLSEFVLSAAASSRQSLQLTTGGIVYPATPAGEDDVVLHVVTWTKYERGLVPRIAECPYYLWLRFESDALRAVELRQHHVASREAPEASVEFWRAAARRGVVVFTHGVTEN